MRNDDRPVHYGLSDSQHDISTDAIRWETSMDYSSLEHIRLKACPIERQEFIAEWFKWKQVREERAKDLILSFQSYFQVASC